MYIVREIFHLQFGRFREVNALIQEAKERNILLQPPGYRMLTDFTGEGYRLILELPFTTLAEYESELKKETGGEGWTEWYERFKVYVRYSEREILKQI